VAESTTADERFTGLPWLLWAGVMVLVVTATTNVAVLGSVALGCWVAMAALGGPRAEVGRLVVGVSLSLAALWALLGVAVQRPGLGGEVVWLLPEWSAATGGTFGGAVTSGQLHLAAARGAQAVALVAVLGLLAHAVSASGWLRLAGATWGGAARVWGPLLCLGEAYAAQRCDARLTRRSGFAGSGRAAVLSEILERAGEISADWFTPRLTRLGPLRALAGVAAVLAICLWWARGAISPTAWPEVSGIELTLLSLAAFILVGLALHGFALPRPTASDAVPLFGAVSVGGCWMLRERTGDAEALVVDFAQAPGLPVSVLLCLAVLPVLAVAAGGRR